MRSDRAGMCIRAPSHAVRDGTSLSPNVYENYIGPTLLV